MNPRRAASEKPVISDRWWFAALDRFGMPTLALIAIGIALYKTGVWAADRVIVPVTERHLKFVDAVQDAQTLNTEKLGDLVREQKETNFQQREATREQKITNTILRSIAKSQSELRGGRTP